MRNPVLLGFFAVASLPGDNGAAFLGPGDVHGGFPVVVAFTIIAAALSQAILGNMNRHRSSIISDTEWMSDTSVPGPRVWWGRVASHGSFALLSALMYSIPLMVSSAAAGLSLSTVVAYLVLVSTWAVAFRLYGALVGAFLERFPILAEVLCWSGAIAILVVLTVLFPPLSPVVAALYEFLGPVGWTELIVVPADAGLGGSIFCALLSILVATILYAVRLRVVKHD